MMKKHSMKKLLSLILCIVLTAALALCITGCSDNSPAGSEAPSSLPASSASESGAQVVGEGAASFGFAVVDLDGSETLFEIHTDKETVGEALQELGLVEGEESEWGLYVKVVNGITADYDVDETYWAFYVDGEYATAGVDSTPIAEGAAYSFVKTGPAADSSAETAVVGEGAVSFPFTVVDAEGAQTVFEVRTDKTTVGEALEELGLLVGEEGPYGLYVKTVNGTTLDYDTDGKYWAFYVNGEYALQGVDLTEIAAGESYMFKAE